MRYAADTLAHVEVVFIEKDPTRSPRIAGAIPRRRQLDFAIVTALRAAGHDVPAIVDINPGCENEKVLAAAPGELRVLLTEAKDFGLLAYAGGQKTAGVVLIAVKYV